MHAYIRDAWGTLTRSPADLARAALDPKLPTRTGPPVHPAQARRVASVALPLLLRPGGLMTSTNPSGNQWHAPFGWAPFQLIAVEGLRRYGLDREADELSLAFLGTVLRDFVDRGAVFEKYDVERRQSTLSTPLRSDYATNEVGFGWTNGVFLELEAGLAPTRRGTIVRAANVGTLERPRP